MKFKDFLSLNEDEGGGESTASSGDGALTNLSTGIDYVEVPISNMKRIQMPQITKELMNDFVADLTHNNIDFKTGVFKKYQDLIPIQKDLNPDKVGVFRSRMIEDIELEPPIISSDNKIVDGNHRYAAQKGKSKIKVHQVDMEFDKLYDFLLNKPYVLRKKIDENKE